MREQTWTDGFCSEMFRFQLLEERSSGLRTLTNQMEKSVSGGPLCPRHVHRKHTQELTHSHTHIAACSQRCRPSTSRTSFGMQPSMGDKKQPFVCPQLFHTSHTWPQQARLEVQASKTTHTHTHAPLWGFFMHELPFLLVDIVWSYSLAQTHLNSPEL